LGSITSFGRDVLEQNYKGDDRNGEENIRWGMSTSKQYILRIDYIFHQQDCQARAKWRDLVTKYEKAIRHFIAIASLPDAVAQCHYCDQRLRPVLKDRPGNYLS
jgi:hypothetical protein